MTSSHDMHVHDYHHIGCAEVAKAQCRFTSQALVHTPVSTIQVHVHLQRQSTFTASHYRNRMQLGVWAHPFSILARKWSSTGYSSHASHVTFPMVFTVEFNTLLPLYTPIAL